jgi:hypothetical protein
MGPGRHRAGDNTFTCFIDPNGNTMEYTTELATLDVNEFITREMFNDLDKGLYVALPL